MNKDYENTFMYRLNTMMQQQPDFTYTKDFHPIMMERSEEYRKLYQEFKMTEFYKNFKLPTKQK